ncbi:hypothetical protein F5Y09DRAFT_307395 [Xylaria sp. FL1042]|nr:hypothetical protein F5Y09DRAFT_307395 [Xylaria sp. FL1042]
MSPSAAELDRIHNIILVVYFVVFLFTRANQIRYFATVMADTMVPQTPPKKLFKPSSKITTPTRSKPSPQSAQPAQPAQQSQTFSSQKTPKDALQSAASDEPTLDSVAKSTNLAPLTDVSATPDKLSEHAGSDTTGETPVGLVDNYVLTPTDTRSRSTDTRSPTPRDVSQSVKRSSSFKDKIAQARESAKRATDGLTKSISDKPVEALQTAADSLSADADADNPPYDLKSPADLAKYFKDQGTPEMSNFVTSLVGNQSSDSSENTPRATKSPAGETQVPDNQADEATSNRQNKSPETSEEVPTNGKLEPAPANLSKTADGTFRDTEGIQSTAQSTSNMGEPDVSSISQAAQPAIPSVTSNAEQPSGRSQQDNQDTDAYVVDNMGRPAHVERSIEIPFQRPQKQVNGSRQPEKQGADLGDFEDLPSVEHLPSTDDLPKIPEYESPDPPEEILDPSVHSTTSSSITPIPKIPKIAHIDSSPPVNLLRLAQGLAGHAIDDVGNIVDELGEVLGYATGDLPAMVGKKVSDNGEIYGDGGEIVGYVSDNFVDPPSPTEIPGDVLGGLRVDHKGNILDSEGKIIGKFHQPPDKKNSPKSSSKAGREEKSKDEQKPKVNAQTGGSPSDLFLDVKSTTDGIQLTIRIPTTFSRPSPES